MKIFIIVFLTCSIINFAQQEPVEIPHDTSYTFYSAAKKMYKKFSEAKLVLPELSPNVKSKKNIVYSKISNRKLHLDIFYSENSNEKKLPCIILIHGGGWRSGDRTMVVPMAQKLAANGFVTAAVEYRLSIEALYPAAVYDIKSAISWVRANAEKYNIDTNKIAIYGCSAGGHLAALVGLTTGVQAIVDVDGVVDFFGKGTEELYKKSGKSSAAHLWLGKSPDEDTDLWKEASPINHVNKKTSPILFVNSGQSRFHAGRDEMVKKLKKYNIYYEVHTLENTIHTFWLFDPWFEKTFNYTLNFLNKVFKNQQINK